MFIDQYTRSILPPFPPIGCGVVERHFEIAQTTKKLHYKLNKAIFEIEENCRDKNCFYFQQTFEVETIIYKTIQCYWGLNSTGN